MIKCFSVNWKPPRRICVHKNWNFVGLYIYFTCITHCTVGYDRDPNSKRYKWMQEGWAWATNRYLIVTYDIWAQACSASPLQKRYCVRQSSTHWTFATAIRLIRAQNSSRSGWDSMLFRFRLTVMPNPSTNTNTLKLTHSHCSTEMQFNSSARRWSQVFEIIQ